MRGVTTPARVQNAQVQTVPPKKQGQPARVNLLVDVVEGEPVRVGKLLVSGLEPLTEAEREQVTADLPLARRRSLTRATGTPPRPRCCAH